MYFLIRLTDLIAEIAFLQVSLTCCLKLSSLSSMTPKSLTLSDNAIIVLPNENWERTGFRAKREVNWITSVFPGLQSNMFCVFQFITALTQFRRVDRWVLWQYKFASRQHRTWSRRYSQQLCLGGVQRINWREEDQWLTLGNTKVYRTRIRCSFPYDDRLRTPTFKWENWF